MSRTKTIKRNESYESHDIKQYDPLVIAIARRYGALFPDIEFEELVAEGKLGLLEASLNYDKSKKASFSTYAWFWIIKNIQNYISKNVNIVETPQNVRNVLSSVKKIVDENTKSGKTVSLEKIAALLGMNSSQISDILTSAERVSNIISLDKEIGYGENTRPVSEIVEDKSQSDIFDFVAKKADNKMLSEMLESLNEKERAVLSFRFALDGHSGKKMSIKHIAEELNISPAKVKDLENSAILKLKGMIKGINE